MTSKEKKHKFVFRRKNFQFGSISTET